MSGRSALRALIALATTVVLVALAIGAALAVAWSALPPDGATLVVDGETVSLPALSGGQKAGVLVLLVVAVLLTSAVVVGAVAIALAMVLFCIGVVAVVVLVTLLLVASPVLLLGWLIWRIAKGPSPAPATPRLA